VKTKPCHPERSEGPLTFVFFADAALIERSRTQLSKRQRNGKDQTSFAALRMTGERDGFL
jgi:hypothetical protein